MKLSIGFTDPLVIRLIIEQPPTPQAECFGVMTLTFANGMFAKGEDMASSMQTGTYATVAVQWVDASGAPAKVDGPTAWASSDPTICECTVATGNPLIANLHAPGPIGNVSIQATADADMGAGVRNITALLDVTVIGGEAVAGAISFSQTPAQGPRGEAKR